MEKWYAFQTEKACESKVAHAFNKKGYEFFLPQVPCQNTGSQGIKALYQPLFPSRIFIYTLSEALKDVQKMSGVLRLLYWLKEPAVFANAEIEMLKRFLPKHQNISVTQIRVNPVQSPKVVRTLKTEDVADGTEENVQLLLPGIGYKITGQAAAYETGEKLTATFSGKASSGW